MSHNTIVVDGSSQSTPVGPISLANTSQRPASRGAAQPGLRLGRSVARRLRCAPAIDGRCFDPPIAGWLVVDEILVRDEAPASHRGSGRRARAATPDGRESRDYVREQQHSPAGSSVRRMRPDALHGPLGQAVHSARAYWHFDPGWSVTADSPGRLHATHVDGGSAWLLHDSGHACLARGNEQSGLGWFAPVYGTLRPAWSAEIAHQAMAPFALVTWIGAATSDGMPVARAPHRRW